MNDIYVLTVTYGPAGTQTSLFFRDRAKAEQYLEPAAEEPAFLGGVDDLGSRLLIDDFGSRLLVTDLISIGVTSMEQSLNVQVEQTVLQQAAQAKAQRRVAAIPSLGRPVGVPAFNG